MNKLLLRQYWLFSSFFKKHYKLLILSIVIGIAVFTQLSKLIQVLPFSSLQTVGRIGTIKLAELPMDVQEKVSFGLTKINSDGSASPDAAQTVTISPDGKTYTVTINPNIVWSTGEKLTSNDIQLELTDVTIDRPSENVITFTLKEPFAPFPTILSQPLLKKISTRWPPKTSIVGLKKYVVTDITTRGQDIRALTLKSNEGSIRYLFYPTEADAVTAFKLGHIDTIERTTTPYLAEWPNTEVETLPQPNRYLALFFNTKDPTLADKSVRQLLTYATPKDKYPVRIISPINNHSWAYNPQVKPYEYNLEAAKALFAKQKSTNADFNLSLNVTTTPTYADIAEAIAATWQSIGIPTKINIVPYPDTNDYQVLLIGQEIPSDPDQYALWHSTQTSNITHYQNPKIDKLLEDGRQEIDQELRKQIYHDFQRFLVEDSPVAFLYQLPLYNTKRL